MKLALVLLVTVLSAKPVFASALLECDLNVAIEENSGILQPGTQFLQISVPLKVLITKAESKVGCDEMVGKSLSIQLTVPLSVLESLQINLKSGSSIDIHYVQVSPKDQPVTEQWLLTKAPSQAPTAPETPETKSFAEQFFSIDSAKLTSDSLEVQQSLALFKAIADQNSVLASEFQKPGIAIKFFSDEVDPYLGGLGGPTRVLSIKALPKAATVFPDKLSLVYEIGWGDCLSFCAYAHTWSIEVTTHKQAESGALAFDVSITESGDPLPEDLEHLPAY